MYVSGDTTVSCNYTYEFFHHVPLHVHCFKIYRLKRAIKNLDFMPSRPHQVRQCIEFLVELNQIMMTTLVSLMSMSILNSLAVDGRKVLTFLVKETETNSFLTAAAAGDAIELSLPQGKGFQIAENFDGYKYDFPVTNVLLMATGSGIAPIAAAIESGILGLKSTAFNSLYAREATLYLGARTPEHIPFRSRFDSWSALGVNVVPVLSKPETSSTKWTGRTGYIQDALTKDTVRVPRNCGALLCGQRSMTDDVKSLLMTSGVFEGRILLNF
jgi:NAD(P)H-flavin reductase